MNFNLATFSILSVILQATGTPAVLTTGGLEGKIIDEKSFAGMKKNESYFRSDDGIANSLLEKSWKGAVVNDEKHYYASNVVTANWFNAARICQLHDMRLATIESAEQYDRLKDGLHKLGVAYDRSFWLGASDLGQWHVHTFYWASTGRPLSFTDWGEGEPNNGSGEEDCLEIVITEGGHKIHWNDRNCWDVNFIICEKDYQLFSRIA